MLSSAFFLAVALLTPATCQSIVPSSVPIDIRDNWCTNQKASCPLLCTQIDQSGDQPSSNLCEPTTLVYSCVCSNGLQPNSSQFSQTIPYYECTEANTQCADNCASGDNACVTQCRTANPCGAQNPIRVNLSTVTSTMSTAAATSAAATTTTKAAATGFGGPNDSAATSLNGLLGQNAGVASLAAGLIAALAVLL